MIHTFDFLTYIWMAEDIKKDVLMNIETKKKENIDIGVHRLKFDFNKRTVQISCNDPHYIFNCKMIPIKMSLESLVNLIEKNFDNRNNKWEFI